MTGFDSKQQMAADKFIAAEERKVGERYGYVPKLHPSEWMDEPAQDSKCKLCVDGCIACDARAQPVQEPVAEVVWGAKTGFEWKFKMLVELACVEDVPVKLYAGEFKGANVYWHDTTPPKRQWIWLSDADIRETIDSICQYSGDYDEFLCKKIERKIKELNT